MFDNSRQLLRCCHSTATNPAVFCSTPLHQVKLENCRKLVWMSVLQKKVPSILFRLTWAEAWIWGWSDGDPKARAKESDNVEVVSLLTTFLRVGTCLQQTVAFVLVLRSLHDWRLTAIAAKLPVNSREPCSALFYSTPSSDPWKLTEIGMVGINVGKILRLSRIIESNRVPRLPGVVCPNWCFPPRFWYVSVLPPLY